MKETIIKGTGNSRTLGSVPNLLTLYPTYEAFAAALAAGEVPVDIGPLNPAGVAQMGDALNKQTLLKDSTAALFGLPNTAVPDEVLAEFYREFKDQFNLISNSVANLQITVKNQIGKPIKSALISGLAAKMDGTGTVYTNSSGVAVGYVKEGSTTLSITGYADVQNYTKAYNIVKGTTIKETWTVTTLNFLKITTSGQWKFTGTPTRIDVSVTGGGGAGGVGGTANNEGGLSSGGGGGGGGGGYTTVKLSAAFSPNTSYQAIIGSGGGASTGATGGSGGASSFLGVTGNGGTGGSGITKYGDLTGGSGGAGQGRGGTGTSSTTVPGNGGASSAAAYNSFTTTEKYGGGGAGGGGFTDSSYVTKTATGGAFGGGNSGQPGTPNTGGGGGGGMRATTTSGRMGGSGGAGVIGVRIHI